MQTLTIPLKLPRDILGLLDVPRAELALRLRELIALELFREQRISSGKGAELLGISKLGFVSLLARYNMSYFTETPEELVNEVAILEQFLGDSNP